MTYNAKSWTTINTTKRAVVMGGKENHEKNMWVDICNGYCSMRMNEGIYNKLISPDILTIIEVCIFGMAWVCGGMDGEGQMLLEGKPGGEWKKEDLH